MKISSVLLVVGASILSISALADSGRVGDIRSSVLSPEKFQEINGPEWVLMDGKTELPAGNLLRASTGWTKIPDARGKFFRMKDHGGGVDKDGDLAIGTIENSKTALPSKNSFVINEAGGYTPSVISGEGAHEHSTDRDGGHQHVVNYNGGFGASGANIGGSHMSINSSRGTEGDANHSHHISRSGGHDHRINPIPAHSHPLTGGDEETRPINMVVNYYIKISEAQDCIKEVNTKEKTLSRYNCLKNNIERWQSGMLSLTEMESGDLIRSLVFMQASSAKKYLGTEEQEYISKLHEKYYSIMTLQ